jgi:DHA1 family bicyclomycin/chloramphenicol resistance-like MFS transporter
MFPPAAAQKVMSQITIYFGVAPAVAPMMGGVLLAHLGWHSVFWFLTAVGVVLWAANYRLLPETLHVTHRQPLKVSNLMQGYWQLGLDPRFLFLALASGIPFNGMFLYVLSAPVFLGEHLALAPTQFFWFFVLTISGIMAGAYVSGRMAGKVAPKRQIRYGFLIMLSIALLNVLANALFKAHVAWAMLPVAIFSFGWAMMVPVITLLVLDLHPDRRGMASSLQAFIGSSANGLVAGVIAPLVMHSTLALAVASLAMLCVGLLSWLWLHRRWPEIGRAIEHPVA